MNVRPLLDVLLCSLPLLGCTADYALRDVDRQVQGLLSDRQQSTLGYTPAVEVPSEAPSSALGTRSLLVPLTARPMVDSVPFEREGEGEVNGPAGPPIPGALPYGDDAMDRLITVEMDRQSAFTYRLGPPSPGEMPLRLDLHGVLRHALDHGREYRTRMDSLYLAALQVTLERHLLSPRPFAGLSVDYTGGQTDAAYESALTATADVGFRQRLPLGGDVTARALVRFVETLTGAVNDQETATLSLRASIPLLRGAGLENVESLVSSERELIYQIRQFESFRRSLVVSIAEEYFSLISAQQQLANRRQNLANLGLLTARTLELFQAGRTSFLEVQRSEQALLQARSTLVQANENYAVQLDRFKSRIGVPVNQPLQVVAVQIETDPPKLDAAQIADTALKYRLELQTARDRIEDAHRAVTFARRGLLPDLRLTAGVQTSSAEDAALTALDNRGLTYDAGLTLDLPLDRVAERNSYRSAIIRYHQAVRACAALEDQVLIEARSASAGVRSAELRVRIERQGIELAERRLTFASELLKQGKSTARELVEAQSSLLTAQDAYSRASAQLQVEVLRMLRDSGTLRVDPDAGILGRIMDRSAPAPQ